MLHSYLSNTLFILFLRQPIHCQMQSDGVGTNCGSIQTTVVAPKACNNQNRNEFMHEALRITDSANPSDTNGRNSLLTNYNATDLASHYGDQFFDNIDDITTERTLAAFTSTILNTSNFSFIDCADCGTQKLNLEDLEVHIKTEHLQWLPFECPLCGVSRATDRQMREHLHSTHRSSSIKFHYIYNEKAKQGLQNIMGLSMVRRIISVQKSQISSMHTAKETTFAKRSNHFGDNNIQNSSACPVIDEPVASKANFVSITENSQDLPLTDESTTGSCITGKRFKPSCLESPYSNKTNMDALLSAINAATNSEISDIPLEVVEEPKFSIADLFTEGKRVKNELEEGPLETNNERDPNEILGNVAALFSDNSLNIRRRSANGVYVTARSKAASSSISKKRVLGLCNKCNKPVTAGARQMHMFYHLAKDYQIYRFRCLYEGCTIEHYRKDQMENHHSKFHGKIDSNLMEDKTTQLFSTCQDLSMQLLGTAGNTPGPTAEKAQLAYNESLATYAMNQSRKRKRYTIPDVFASKELRTASSSFAKISCQNLCKLESNLRSQKLAKPYQSLLNEQNINSNVENSKNFSPHVYESESLRLTSSSQLPSPVSSSVNSEGSKGASDTIKLSMDDFLKCRICSKLVKNKIRGLHVLNHLAKDVGINRYACKLCDFGHERSQSVQIHSKREHGQDDCIEDRIQLYAKEVQEMSEKCFGFHALYGQDCKGRNKIPVTEESCNEDSQVIDRSCTQTDHLLPKSLPHTTSSIASRFRKLKSRRFGIRKQPSRSKRKEMAILREKSIKFGGAQYIRKRTNETAQCEKCGVEITSRLIHHAYTHLNKNLFLCPICNLGSSNRDTMIRHIRDIHDSSFNPTDDRITYAKEIKEIIKACFSDFFVDAPLPTTEDYAKLLRKSGEVTSHSRNNESIMEQDNLKKQQKLVIKVNSEEDVDDGNRNMKAVNSQNANGIDTSLNEVRKDEAVLTNAHDIIQNEWCSHIEVNLENSDI